VRIAAFLNENGVSPASICDVGCGTGGVLAALSPRFPSARIVGYELSPQASQLARRLHPDVDVRQEDVFLSAEHFELAMLIDVFEHVEDYIGFLRRAKFVGDKLLCHIPLDMNALTVAREHRVRAKREDVGHLHYFSKWTALETLKDAGFDIVDTRYTWMGIDIPETSIKQRMIQTAMRLGRRVSPDTTARVLGGASLLVLASPTD